MEHNKCFMLSASLKADINSLSYIGLRILELNHCLTDIVLNTSRLLKEEECTFFYKPPPKSPRVVKTGEGEDHRQGSFKPIRLSSRIHDNSRYKLQELCVEAPFN